MEGAGQEVTTFRSAQWYAGTDRNAYIHRAWMRRGLPRHAFDGRPHIAIANTASDLTPCNVHLDEVAASVKQGVWEAGGVPLNLPVVSLGETQVRPTAMLWRNLAAMATEEMLRANPVDGVVLLGGCDKTIPSLLMAAASVDLPAVVVPGGPMLTGHFQGATLGCGTDVWRLGEEVRAGRLPAETFLQSESAMIRSRGHCNTMGTASTMACLAEALGTTIPGVAGTPAPDSRLLEQAHLTGRLAVELVEQERRPSSILTRGSFHNAIVTLAAIGGSTNAVVHLLALAGRVGVDLTLDDFDRTGSGVPLLVDLQPAGRHLMDDLHRAGGRHRRPPCRSRGGRRRRPRPGPHRGPDRPGRPRPHAAPGRPTNRPAPPKPVPGDHHRLRLPTQWLAAPLHRPRPPGRPRRRPRLPGRPPRPPGHPRIPLRPPTLGSNPGRLRAGSVSSIVGATP